MRCGGIRASGGAVERKDGSHERRDREYGQVQRSGRPKLGQRIESAARQSRCPGDQVIQMKHTEGEAKRIPAADSLQLEKTERSSARLLGFYERSQICSGATMISAWKNPRTMGKNSRECVSLFLG
jgi:hypothetical protein